MLEIKTSVVINAPIEAVWSCLIDSAKYPAWNQFIRKVDGNFAEGQTIKIELLFPDGKAMKFAPTCLNVEDKKELRWVGKLGFDCIFRGEHYFQVEKINDTQTKLIHGELFTGILIPIFKKLRGDVTRQGFEVMNNNLSAHLGAV